MREKKRKEKKGKRKKEKGKRKKKKEKERKRGKFSTLARADENNIVANAEIEGCK